MAQDVAAPIHSSGCRQRFRDEERDGDHVEQLTLGKATVIREPMIAPDRGDAAEQHQAPVDTAGEMPDYRG